MTLVVSVIVVTFLKILLTFLTPILFYSILLESITVNKGALQCNTLLKVLGCRM